MRRERECSLFDTFSSDDLIFAFFPCVRFTDMCLLTFTGHSAHNWSIEQKIERSKKLGTEQANLYELFCDLFLICIRKNLKLIVENPYSSRHYATMHFPIAATIIDKDRRLLGDNFCKPTSYWFLNIAPKFNKIE